MRYGTYRTKHYNISDYPDIIDELLKTAIHKGIGIEINTAGLKHKLGFPHPHPDILKRYRELGGEIITIGSDAHTASRVGQYSFDACEILKDIFGYVCTFEGRKPIFHKL